MLHCGDDLTPDVQLGRHPIEAVGVQPDHGLGDHGCRIELVGNRNPVLALEATFREPGPDFPPEARLVGALAVALQPLFGFISGGVSPDSLLTLFCTATFYLLARAFRRGLTPRLGGLIGLTLALATLAPLHPEIDGFSITAGNSSGLNDAGCAVVVADRDYAEEHGLEPLAIVRSWASVGVPPRDTGLAPTLAIPKAAERAGVTVADLDLVEINEAFAAMAVASSRILGLPHEIVNVNGSGCSLGHPVAATGARMVATTIFELRRRGGGLGCVSMCAGGGMGSATVLEVLPAS